MSRRQNVMALCLLFLALFGAYLRTLNPAFRADDSPETTASCVTLGIQHPPGYPLHTLVGRIASLAPLGSPAFRLNLMAAFFAALAAAALAAGAGLFAGVIFGLSPTLWSQALSAKGGIYTLHAAFLAALFLVLIAWREDSATLLGRPQASRLRLFRSKYFLLTALIFCLGLGNHWETQALFSGALLLWLWAQLREIQIDRSMPAGRGLGTPLLKGLGLGLAGLSVYLLLPLRSRLDPVMNWGEPSSWKQFKWVLLRQEYVDLEVGFLKSLKAALFSGGAWAEVSKNWATVHAQGLRVFSHLFGLSGELTLLGALLAAYGAWVLWEKKEKATLGFLLGVLASFIGVITLYFHLKTEMIWILDVFLIPAVFAMAALAGYALRRLAPGPPAQIGAALLAFLCLAAWRGPTLSQRDHYLAWDFGRNFLLSCRRDAIVFAEGDFNTMPIYYLQNVKGERRDVDHITTIFASTDWGLEQIKRRHPRLAVNTKARPVTNQRVGDGAQLAEFMGELIQKFQGKRPIQASLFRQVQSENLRWAEPHFKPEGLTVLLNPVEGPATAARRLNLAKAMTLRYLPGEKSRLEPSPEFALSNYGTLYMELAGWLRNQGRLPEALALYARAADVTSRPNLAEAYTHWGIALASSGKLEEGMEKFKLAVEVKPLFEAWANMAGTANQLKRYTEAESCARKAVELGPENGQSWNNLAISLYYQGRKAEALEILEKAARLSPSDPGIQANLQALRAGK